MAPALKMPAHFPQLVYERIIQDERKISFYIDNRKEISSKVSKLGVWCGGCRF
jgi:hypothetical protein